MPLPPRNPDHRSNDGDGLPILGQDTRFDGNGSSGLPERPEALELEELLPGQDDERSVLITGAAGNIGRKLVAAWSDDYELVLIDRRPCDDLPDLVVADLTQYDEDWADLFEEVDTVIHLAANPSEFASWPELIGPNLDALNNVMLSAALCGVERLVYASSNHAMGGYRDRSETPISIELPPRPGNAYGAAKLMGERLAQALTRTTQISVVALRLGWVLPGDNRPEELPDDWSRQLWLSNRDLVNLFECAVEADLGDYPFVLANGLSANRETRWDLSDAIEKLGYVPMDDAFAKPFRPGD